MEAEIRFGVIGVGNMGEAIVRGVVGALFSLANVYGLRTSTAPKWTASVKNLG